MRTRSSSNLPGESPPNPSSSNPKHRNHRRSKQPFILKESPEEAVVVPPILAEQFELKHNLINMMTSDQFFELEKDNPHDHIRCDANSSSSSEIAKLTHAVNQQISAVTIAMTVIPKQFHATPPPAFVKAVEEIYVTCGCSHPYYQCLAAGGNTFLELRDNIQGYVSAAAVNYNQGNSGYRPSVVPLSELEKIKRMNEANIKAMQTQINNVKNELRNEMKNLIQASMSNQTNELKNMIASFFQMNTASTSGSGPLPSNTIANLKGELKAITTRSGIVLDGPSVPIPPTFINPEEDERIEETLTDQDPAEYTIKVPPPFVHKPKPPSQRNFFVHQRDPLHPNIPYPSRMHKQKHEDFLENLFATNHQSGNPTFSSHPELTSPKVKDDIFDPEGGNVLIDKVVNPDSTKDLPPPHNVNPLNGSTTSSSSPNHFLEEFVDKLSLITFPPGNDDLPFEIGSDLKEIEYLLNNDPIKEMDSILEDSVDEDNLTDLNDNLADTMPDMFTDEYALNYSSLSLYDEYDNDLFEVESDTEYVYDDPFDSKGEKIKESKLLINEFDLPKSNDFLPSSEYDSFLFEDFSKVDALPSTDNKDKVFNPGILIQKHLSEVNTRVIPDKNVKKIAISHASLILEDFDPPLYELPFLKEVPGSETLLSFSFENEEKVFKRGILTSKGVHFSLLSKISHRGHKVFKIIKILESPMDIFPCFYGEDIHILDVPCLHFYPHERINSEVRSS
uniref:Reverse transcriptase domain-containing protein n=1 Tax=Tanacetum cinerariifolium TaxID=118510 RepID=A0A699I396_TANCI|nr:hypothetical protein [Tanacetum cinerariifolium]